MSNERDDKSYSVGFGRPPRHTRFQPGRSGNPRGRPREAKNLATLLAKALDQKVTIVGENGRRRKASKREAIITQLVNKSAQADLKAMQILIGMVQEIERRATPGEPSGLSEADRQALAIIRNWQVGETHGGSDV